MNYQQFYNFLTEFLQYNVQILKYVENEEILLREGKLININIKVPYIYFKLEFREKIREYNYPIPFKYFKENDNIIFDYSLKHLSHNDSVILDKLHNLPYDVENSLYNGYLIIKQNG